MYATCLTFHKKYKKTKIQQLEKSENWNVKELYSKNRVTAPIIYKAQIKNKKIKTTRAPSGCLLSVDCLLLLLVVTSRHYLPTPILQSEIEK
jgi:hypothetical protein